MHTLVLIAPKNNFISGFEAKACDYLSYTTSRDTTPDLPEAAALPRDKANRTSASRETSDLCDAIQVGTILTRAALL